MGRQLQVGTVGCQLDEPAAQQLEHKVCKNDHECAQRQHPQGVGGLVGHYAVIDVHHEQRHDQGKQVDEKTGHQHIAVQAAVLHDDTPEPVALTDHGLLATFLLQLDRMIAVEDMAGILLLQLGHGQGFALHAKLGQQYSGTTLPAIQTVQNAGTVILENQHTGQQQRIDTAQRRLHQLGLQAGPTGGTGKQRWRQAAIDQWQAFGQRILCGGNAMMASQPEQAAAQTVCCVHDSSPVMAEAVPRVRRPCPMAYQLRTTVRVTRRFSARP